MRFRRAMGLHVDFQNVSSSGIQSEIQDGSRLLISVVLVRLGIGPVSRRQQPPPPGAGKRFSPGGGVACSVRDRRAAPAAATAWLRLYKLRANCGLRG